MSTNIKIIILVAVIVGDLAALAIMAPRLLRQGRGIALPFIGMSMVISSAIIGWVLFSVVE